MNPPSGKSELAAQARRQRDVSDRTAEIWGLAVHQTGSGITGAAAAAGVPALEYAVAHYSTPGENFAHYVVDYDGAIVQIADERERAWHVGLSAEERRLYLSGEWERMLPKKLVDLWKRRWPAYSSPAHLFPGTSPNNVYCGVELLPLEPKPAGFEPMFPGARHTLAQHQAVAMLAADLGDRRGLPRGWHRTGRLVGHEDLEPLARSTRGAGWDPGFLRPGGDLYFDLDFVRRLLDAREGVGQVA